MIRRTATGYVAAFPAMERLAVGCNIYVEGRILNLSKLLELSQSQKILPSKNSGGGSANLSLGEPYSPTRCIDIQTHSALA